MVRRGHTQRRNLCNVYSYRFKEKKKRKDRGKNLSSLTCYKLRERKPSVSHIRQNPLRFSVNISSCEWKGVEERTWRESICLFFNVWIAPAEYLSRSPKIQWEMLVLGNIYAFWSKDFFILVRVLTSQVLNLQNVWTMNGKHTQQPNNSPHPWKLLVANSWSVWQYGGRSSSERF